MVLEEHAHDLRGALARAAARGDLRGDLAPLARHPLLVDEQEHLSLVLEVLVERGGRVACLARDAVRVRSFVAIPVEDLGGCLNEPRARLFGQAAARAWS